jgi:hypothetical protein
MALEVRYVPMLDEGDRGMPKIMRVIYNEAGDVLTYSSATFTEAETADPSCIAPYFDLLREYFISFSAYLDTQTAFTSEVSMKMFELMTFCGMYLEGKPVSFVNEASA